MKPDEAVKEALKPPFKMNGLFLLIADQHRKSNKTASQITKFIEAAVDEKWRKDFDEPLRWIRLVKAGVNDRNTCPNCKVNRAKATNYCPSCGVRLLPPEVKTEKLGEEK